MFAKDCIDASIPFLRTTDTIGYALELMQEFKTEALAVVQDEKYIGMVTENYLLELDDILIIEALQEHFLQHKIEEDMHVFDVLKVATETSVYCSPVISPENDYLGTTTAQKLLQTLAMYSSLAASGGVIVLELETRNYSLTEISRIVESNNAVILHSMVASSANQNYMQVSLKINKNDLKDIQLTFERYQYTVLAVLHQSEYEMQLKERYDSLMRYLEV